MLRTIIYIAAAISLSACSWFGATSTPPGDTGTKITGDTSKIAPREAIGFEGLRATSAERATCEAAGGKVVMAGLRGADNCIRPYSDGGKSCSDSSDCQGMCYVVGSNPGMGEKTDAGQCAMDDNIFGCRTTVANGRTEGTLCVD